MKNNKSFTLTLLLLVLILVSFGCVGGTTEQPEETSAPSLTSTEAPDDPTQDETIEQKPSETKPTVTRIPTLPPAPVLQPDPPIVTKSGFGQDGVSTGFGFMIENPNMGIAFEDTHYEVFAYDDNGVEIGTAFGYITLLLPEQTLGIGGHLIIINKDTISSLEIQINPGEPKIPDSFPAFSVESTAFMAGEYASNISGVINNLNDIDYNHLSIYGIVYDGAGNIIGGGHGYKGYILANDWGGFVVPVVSAGEAAHVELYPTISATSLLGIEKLVPVVPADAINIELLNSGFGQLRNESGFGMHILNPNSGYVVELSKYEVIVFAADGTVLQVAEGYIGVLLPEQLLGFGSDLHVSKESEIDHVEVKLINGDFVESGPLPVLSSDNVVFKPDSHYPKVSGDIVNPYDNPLTGLSVYAIALDENGKIIGGGYSLGYSISANGITSLEISVAVDGTPASVELYAVFPNLSDIE